MIGIDIGSKSIKIVELLKSGNSYSLKSSGAVGFTGISPDRIIEEKDFIALSEIIKKLVKQIGVYSKEVNLSIPESIVFTRIVKFPLLSDEEVDAAVKWEAEQYIPIPVAEAVIQYTILGKDQTAQQTSVLLVASPKAVVEKYIKVLRLSGLTPIIAETELTALSRSLLADKGTSLLLDLGASATDMAIVKDKNILFTRSIPVAGEAFTRAVAQGLGITPAQSEEYKKTYGLSDNQLEGKVKAALLPVMKMVTDEIKKAINFFQTEEKGEAPTSIVITGGASAMPEIVPFLTTSLGIETIVGRSFSKVSLDADSMKNLAPYENIYGTAVGLAMRDE